MGSLGSLWLLKQAMGSLRILTRERHGPNGGSYKRDSSNREPRETWDSQVFQTVRGMLEEREESYSRGLPFQFENHDLEKALSKDKPLNHDS